MELHAPGPDIGAENKRESDTQWLPLGGVCMNGGNKPAT